MCIRQDVFICRFFDIKYRRICIRTLKVEYQSTALVFKRTSINYFCFLEN